MDFGLTAEQETLQKVARSFVAKHCPATKAKEWDEKNEFPSEVWDLMAELGWFGLPYPLELGGTDGTPIELTILAEELGRSSLDMAMSYIGTFIPGLTLSKWASSEQLSRLRDGLVEGKHRFAMAISEPDAGSDAWAIRTRARRDGDDYVVNGRKMWCTGAGLPGAKIATYVRTGEGATGREGLSLLVIDADTPGIEIHRIPTLARHILGTNEVIFDDVRVPAADLIGPEGEGWRVMMSNLEIERVLMSGAYVGAAQATLDDALKYSKERVQFGRPIGTFQSVAHDLADMQTEIDAARLLAYRAAWTLSQGRPVTTHGSMAKLKGSETYVAAARLGMQVLAGYGFATESVMSFRWREAIVAPISAGTSQIQRNMIARGLGLKTY
jgi:alkylation response protein AidB-like acyl-CoA dehydrogenase